MRSILTISQARGRYEVALQNGPQRAVNKAFADLETALAAASPTELDADRAIGAAEAARAAAYYTRVARRSS